MKTEFFQLPWTVTLKYFIYVTLMKICGTYIIYYLRHHHREAFVWWGLRPMDGGGFCPGRANVLLLSYPVGQEYVRTTASELQLSVFGHRIGLVLIS